LDSESLLLGGGSADSLNNSLDAAYWHKFINTYVSFSPRSPSLSLSLSPSLVLVFALSSPDRREGTGMATSWNASRSRPRPRSCATPLPAPLPTHSSRTRVPDLRSALCLAHLSLSLWSSSLSLTRDVRVCVAWHTHDRQPVLRHVAATAVASAGLLLVLHLL
jgi:hypothetical protein